MSQNDKRNPPEPPKPDGRTEKGMNPIPSQEKIPKNPPPPPPQKRESGS